MRHLVKGRKFHRKRGPRRAFLRGLAANLVVKRKMVTTEARAKEVRAAVEKLVTRARRGQTSDLRLLLRRLPRKAAMTLFHDIAPRYKGRRGGYTRIEKLGKMRKRDAARMARIAFVE